MLESFNTTFKKKNMIINVNKKLFSISLGDVQMQSYTLEKGSWGGRGGQSLKRDKIIFEQRPLRFTNYVNIQPEFHLRIIN